MLGIGRRRERSIRPNPSRIDASFCTGGGGGARRQAAGPSHSSSTVNKSRERKHVVHRLSQLANELSSALSEFQEPDSPPPPSVHQHQNHQHRRHSSAEISETEQDPIPTFVGTSSSENPICKLRGTRNEVVEFKEGDVILVDVILTYIARDSDGKVDLLGTESFRVTSTNSIIKVVQSDRHPKPLARLTVGQKSSHYTAHDSIKVNRLEFEAQLNSTMTDQDAVIDDGKLPSQRLFSQRTILDNAHGNAIKHPPSVQWSAEVFQRLIVGL